MKMSSSLTKVLINDKQPQNQHFFSNLTHGNAMTRPKLRYHIVSHFGKSKQTYTMDRTGTPILFPTPFFM